MDRTVTTTIELLDPTNNLPAAMGREHFQRRGRVYASGTNWVEINLHRLCARRFDEAPLLDAAYQICSSRADKGPMTAVWPVPLRQRLPVIPVSLSTVDVQVPLDLQEALNRAYDVSGCDLQIDYGRDPVPPLSPADAAWARELLDGH